MKLNIPKTIEWNGREAIIIDQTLLPLKCKKLHIQDAEKMAEAIKMLRIRGAPAIGVAAAFGLFLGLKKSGDVSKKNFNKYYKLIHSTRPTAVNLFWAIERMKDRYNEVYKRGDKGDILKVLEEEAVHILKDDEERCLRLGGYGSELIKDGDTILTHCNAGAMATAGIGTALAVIYYAAAQGKNIKVYADETRPLLQGSRITAWELEEAGIDVTVITDNMAGWVMKTKGINSIIVGADRIAANGDAANKIGTYSLSILAKEHKIPFYIVAPISTIDFSIKSGKDIPIEERDREEIINRFGKLTAPKNVKTFNPAFDVSDADNIKAIVTDKGIVSRPYRKNLKKLILLENKR